MELHGEEQPPPPQEPWGRLLRLGAEEDEPQILLWKREWTIGRRRAINWSLEITVNLQWMKYLVR
uniref:Checkpoint with forkhead and ring finger domains n=1 Tax=Mus musculus TaxID=10090 RepID=A0A0G2JG18_MOUSE